MKQITILSLLFIAAVICVAAQTVPIGTTQVLQPAYAMGMNIWTAPDPTLAGQVAVDCGTSGNITACVSDRTAVTNEMQARAAMFMKTAHDLNPTAVDSLLKQFGLWYLPPSGQ